MLQRIIDFSLKNKFLVLLATVGLVLGGLYALRNIPLDAIPDLSDTQVIIYTEWPGQAPQIVAGPSHLSHHDQDALGAAGQSRARLLLLRLLVRLCHFRGRHRSLLGAQPGAGIPEQPRAGSCPKTSRRRSARTPPASAGRSCIRSIPPTATWPNCARCRIGI